MRSPKLVASPGQGILMCESLSREEIPESALQSMQDEVVGRCILLVPTSRVRIIWDVMLVMLVLWNMVVLPIDLAFKVRRPVN